MKADQTRVSALLVQTVSLLCKNGLHFEKSLQIQGVLGITIDEKDVFIVQLDDTLWPKQIEKVSNNNDRILKTNISANNSDTYFNNNTFKNTILDQQISHSDTSFNNYSNNVSASPEDNTIQNVEDEQDNNKILFVKTEVSVIDDRKENEEFGEISSNDQPPNIYNNELIPVNQNSQPLNKNLNYQPSNADNISFKHEGGRKRKVSRRAEDNLNMAPIENLENSQISSYDNFHNFKNDLTADLVKESWTYTKYRHTSKSSPKSLQRGYQSPGNNYEDNESLMLFNNNTNDNQFNINNNTSNEQHFQSNHSNLPRRRSNMKTVVCQYPNCGKTFCHSCHLYRHQRLKHGHRFGVVAQTSFSCQHLECGKVFYRRSSLVNHCLHVHSSSAEPYNQLPSHYPLFPPPSNNLFLSNYQDTNGCDDEEDQFNEAADDMATSNSHNEAAGGMATSHSHNEGAGGSDAFLTDNKSELKEDIFDG